MRAVRVTLGPHATEHAVSALFREEPSVVRERIYHLNLLEDGTMVLLGRLRGDLDRARAILAGEPEVLGYSVTPRGDGTGVGYVHTRPPPAVRRFVELPRRHEVFVEFPIEATPDGRYRVELVGETDDVLRAALADVPPGLDVSIERLGPHIADPGGPLEALTARQREVLATAADLGYYSVPRRATLRDVAGALGLAPGTVAEHLQKAEARLVDAVLG